MANTHHTLPQRIAILIEAERRGCTQQALCERHGISRQTLWRWRADISPHLIEREARRLKPLTLAELRRSGDTSKDPLEDGEPSEQDPEGYALMLEAEQAQWARLDQERAARREQRRTARARREQRPVTPRTIVSKAIPELDGVLLRIHGRLPTNQGPGFKLTLPQDLHDRLGNPEEVVGHRSHAIVGLLRYALDRLEREECCLHLYAPSRTETPQAFNRKVRLLRTPDHRS
ncbi:MAG: hypothetical protein Q4F49_05200 [Pseudoxanthomonas suwonensis]|nr:hypothetical protein [Pseudoxanthomonas suwonensis]